MIRLRELREKRGLSMKDAADLLNTPYTTYVNYEKGTREPNFEALFRLADFFGVSIDALLGHCTPNEPLTCDGCLYIDQEVAPCAGCVRAKKTMDYYRRPPEGEEEA